MIILSDFMVAILNFAFLKIPQGSQTHIRRDITTRMLEIHNQSRKKYISQNKVTLVTLKIHNWLPD